MKLIIDIPKDVVADVKDTYTGDDVLYCAVKYGKPYTNHNAKAFKECQRLRQAVEDIKAEINQICDDNGYQRIHKDDVFKIIDRHIGERSEDDK